MDNWRYKGVDEHNVSLLDNRSYIKLNILPMVLGVSNELGDEE